jgi:hypothetical protein
VSPVADKLREARALIERGWTQKVGARDSGGTPVWGGEKAAVSWCAVGAICTVGAKMAPFRQANNLNGWGGISVWNDAPERTQAEVLAAFDKAIELAEAQS